MTASPAIVEERHVDKTSGTYTVRPEVAPPDRPVREWVLVIKTPLPSLGNDYSETQTRYFTANGEGASDIIEALEHIGIDDEALTLLEWAALPMELTEGDDVAKLIMGNGDIKIELIKLLRDHRGKLTAKLLRSLNPKRNRTQRGPVELWIFDPKNVGDLGITPTVVRYTPPRPGTLRLPTRMRTAAKA